jgi:phosphoribosylamine--glycine ligase
VNVLVLGSGGREHALAWKLAQAESARVFALPGNPGIENAAACIQGDPMDFDGVANACKSRKIDLVVVGPENPLIAGITDHLTRRGLLVFGPSKACARIEGSKAFAKAFMRECGIPTADFETFADQQPALDFAVHKLRSEGGVVVKADGQALGKGVFVCDSFEQTREAVRAILVEKRFGDAGSGVVVESRLSGTELSLIAVCSGTEYRLLPVCRDYKRALDGDRGPNTGGMGAVSPLEKISTQTASELGERFIAPVLRRMEAEGTPYCGALFAGLMLTDSGPFALEYNCRFGDPETQAAMLRIESDFAQLLAAAARSEPLPEIQVSDHASVVVVIAAKGYPGDYAKGIPIPDLAMSGVEVFHAGTNRRGSQLVSSGGRVLNVGALGASVEQAAKKVYNTIAGRFGSEWQYRSDIGVAQFVRHDA